MATMQTWGHAAIAGHGFTFVDAETVSGQVVLLVGSPITWRVDIFGTVPMHAQIWNGQHVEDQVHLEVLAGETSRLLVPVEYVNVELPHAVPWPNPGWHQDPSAIADLEQLWAA